MIYTSNFNRMLMFYFPLCNMNNISFMFEFCQIVYYFSDFRKKCNCMCMEKEVILNDYLKLA